MTSSPRTDTFVAILERELGADPGRPLVTAYDDDSGARTELSVTTYANWVAKTANLLVDEYLLDDRDTVGIDLPCHWLAAVFLGAAWSAGIAVTTDPAVPVHLLIRGPGAPTDPSGWTEAPELACSLDPFARRFSGPLPDGVDDFGELWPAQPDVFVPATAPSPATVAWRLPSASHSQAELIAAAGRADWPGDRLLTDVPPTARCGTTAFLAALVRAGSLVLLQHPDAASWDRHRTAERTTGELRAADLSRQP